MKTKSTWKFRSIVGKMMMGLFLVAMIGSIGVGPALGRDDHSRKRNHDNGRYENRGRGFDHHRYDKSGRLYYHDLGGRRVYRPYGYRERIYVPPQVIYEPPPPFGISIFFPPIIIHP